MPAQIQCRDSQNQWRRKSSAATGNINAARGYSIHAFRAIIVARAFDAANDLF
jgi:hypothetical protein